MKSDIPEKWDLGSLSDHILEVFRDKLVAMSTLLGADLWCAERVDLSSVKKEVSSARSK